MAFPPLLKRRPPDKAPPRLPAVADPQSRTRARRRLIGAAVLVALGVIAFPIVFESQPRPIPVDVSMAIPPRDGTAPLGAADRQKRVTSGTIGETVQAASPTAEAASATKSEGSALPEVSRSASSAIEASASPAAAAPLAVQPPAPIRPVEPPKSPAKEVVKAAEKPAAKPAEKAVERQPEKAPKPPAEKLAEKLPAKPADKVADKTAPAAETAKVVRYVVQVGAFADEASAKDARTRVERLGLKTFTQDVEVQGARRIRVRIGPFESQAEADRVVAALKAGKLPGAVLKL